MRLLFQKLENKNLKKKRIVAVVTALLGAALILGIGVGFAMTVKQMQEITNQLVYLQDTSDIIQSDLGSLQSDIKKTLEEENSMVESYSIDVVETNFAAESYTVKVDVIPKEYTDQTKASVFFGTKEYPLTLNGYTYQGTMVLSTRESYDGNITFLFQNGEKKSTEVLKNYVGFISGLEFTSVKGILEKNPEFSKGVLQLHSSLEYELEGAGEYKFSSFMCVVEKDGEPIFEKEFLTETPEEESDTVDFFQGMVEGDDVDSTEVSAGQEIFIEPVDGSSGTLSLEFKQEVESDALVRVYLKAVSTEGYTFFYDIFQGTTGEEEGFVEETSSEVNSYYVMDEKGGILTLN